MVTEIFVFGSNLAGRHGKGAALCAAKEHGAIYGQGEGLQGNCYAIPTKDKELRTRDIEAIAASVEEFKRFAYDNPQLTFNVTKVGCGLAGIAEPVMQAMFDGCPVNCRLPEGWGVYSSDH